MAITQPILVNRAENFFGNSGDYYLSISGEKSWFCCFFEKNYIFGKKMGVAATLAPKDLGS